MDDRDLARAVAAEVGLPGVPVSMRAPADAPGPGVGTGHWRRRVAGLSAAIGRARAAIAEAPPGGVRDELARLLHILELRAARYERMAAVGQALAPDDDTTEADGIAPGQEPTLDGAALEIDHRLLRGLAHLTAVAMATEAIALAAAGRRDPESVARELAALFAAIPAP
jgi:hypothetical protein